MNEIFVLLRLFDGRTLFLAGTLVAGTFAPVMLVNAFRSKRYPGYKWWAAAEICLAASFLAQVVRGYLPEEIPVVAGNLAMILALTFLAIGIFRFTKKRIHIWPLILFSALSFLVILAYFFLSNQMRFRTLAEAVFSLGVISYTAWPLCKKAPEGRVFGYRFALGTLLFGGLLSGVRVFALLRVHEMHTMYTGRAIDNLYYLNSLMFLIGITFSFFILVNERSVAELEQEISSRKVLEGRLRELTLTDELTSVLNRRGLQEAMTREAHRASRLEHPLCLLVLDLDNFKKINDLYGHQVGDLALISFTKTCGRYLREIDILGRSGGDEFLVILPETNASQALIVAEKLQRSLQATVVVTSEGEISLTASIGIAARPAQDLTGNETLQRADQACYQAKKAGRNCIRIYTEESFPSMLPLPESKAHHRMSASSPTFREPGRN